MKAVIFALLATALSAPPVSAQDFSRAQITTYIDTHRREIVRELVELLSIPNVASDKENIRRNAAHLRAMFARRGFAAELLETTGNPLVYAELRVPGATRTLLFYSHYDGQAVNAPAWKQADPWTPVLRDQTGTVTNCLQKGSIGDCPGFAGPDWRLYARSAADDKGPIVMMVAALDALRANGLPPTSNIRVILDGEEEASSPSLVPAIAKYRDKFAADLMIIFDGPVHTSGRPTIAYGARGILTGTLTVYGPMSGVHSGNYGNWIPNPAQRLAHLIASVRNDEGKVLVGGFYDGLQPLTAEERAMLAAVPDDSERMLRTFGVAAPEVPGRSLQEGLQEPTLNVRGLASAFVGPGARTIIPSHAVAEIDIRLVKETRAAALRDKVDAHLRAQGYHLLDREPNADERARHPRLASMVWDRSATEAFRTSPMDPQSRALAAALTRVHGAPPVQLRTLGGTVPIAPFIEALGFPAALVPTVNFDNNQHEENENLRLGHLFDGIVTVAAVLRM
jgi:acetylornithine deacetylase/succinyl-diaminopimelate desuccinylase-like protein